MMSIHETLRRYFVTEILKGRVPDRFDDDLNLIDAGLIDSMSTMNLVTYLEREHGVEFGINDIVPANFASINALAAFVIERTTR